MLRNHIAQAAARLGWHMHDSQSIASSAPLTHGSRYTKAAIPQKSWYEEKISADLLLLAYSFRFSNATSKHFLPPPAVVLPDYEYVDS